MYANTGNYVIGFSSLNLTLTLNLTFFLYIYVLINVYDLYHASITPKIRLRNFQSITSTMRDVKYFIKVPAIIYKN